MAPGSPAALGARLFVLALLAGCAGEPAAVSSWGTLDVMGPEQGFSVAPLPVDWAALGGRIEDHLAVVDRDGVPALKVSSGDETFAVVRRTEAVLLATPYLSWAWSVEPHGAPVHPVRLVVGFRGGAGKRATVAGGAPPWRSAGLPPYDRALAIGWGRSALGRGSMTEPDVVGVAPLYTARGGRENSGHWWLETVDLAALYAKAWPADDPALARVAFIGFSAVGGESASAAYFSGIRLSR
jgi:hypothetical protein